MLAEDSVRHQVKSQTIDKLMTVVLTGPELCAKQCVSLAGESPAAPSQGGCVDKRPSETRWPRGRRHAEGRVSIARWNPKGLRRTSGP